MKNFSDTIGNGTRDLQACSAVPQPTALPRGPALCGTWLISQPQSEIIQGRSEFESVSAQGLIKAG
jgi:hypothetical protein